MLIHGRLLLTHNHLMLDEVRSLLQKSLRRQSPIAFQATKELIGYGKDQLPWKSIITFIFEDHCLNNVNFFKELFRLFEGKDKYGSIELIHRGYTCRHAACLQVVALDDDYCSEAEYFLTDLPLTSELVGLVEQDAGNIDMNLVIANIVKYWQEHKWKVLARLFMVINMAAKVEKRKLTKAGVRYQVFLDIKKPNLYHLVLSILYKHTTDEYTKSLVHMCLKFSAIPDVPQGLILFTVLSNLMYVDTVKEAYIDCSNLGQVDWKGVKKLDTMPDWAVDKHTFRGKFGKMSKHIYLKKFKHNSALSERELEEFHGPRPKSDLKTFFEDGCICNNDILPNNPIWEQTKNMYFKQKPSQQKSAKMTQALYVKMKESKSILFGKTSLTGSLSNQADETKRKGKKTVESKKCEPSVKKISDTLRRLTSEKSTEGEGNNVKESGTDRMEVKFKRKIANETDEKVPTQKKLKLETSTSMAEHDTKQSNDIPNGPLLQLPTGSAKVYTRLDKSSGMVWKGPYKTRDKQNLCMFFHKAMVEVFADKHTLQYEQKGQYIVFPLIQMNEGKQPDIHVKSFYDCIAKDNVVDGEFVERSSLGIIQLHKLEPIALESLPVSVWAHFAFRYVLNIGDSGIYNAITTLDLKKLYGIDMEENRSKVKGNGLLDLIFVKQPSKQLKDAIERALLNNIDEFYNIVCRKFDLVKLQQLYHHFGLHDETDRCKTRLEELQSALNRMCKQDIGV